MKGDIQLKQDVMEELAWDPAVDATGIGVEVQDGIVTLSGHLPTFAEKYAAEAAAQRVTGLKGLAVELDVRLPDDAQRTDADIARAARHVLDWMSGLPADRIHLMVEHGAVTLRGEVDWNYQRVAAEQAVAGLFGVRGVSNGLAVRPAMAADDVRQRIRQAIERQASDDAGHVSVEVSEGVVTLRGTLRTWAERQAAFEAAWSAPGVSAVHNQIQVTL
ncbi:OsmY domain-containing protein [Cupriavidus sp. USMAA2-4]|uniref:OsmY domain-containing protein n=1 Tax=Cupriavidus malaysiensis TaxID=367825 RepID=A0ABN4TVT2_9BURK|nr:MULTISPECIES: BON domain-containing protein [Cupriavidus]AOY95020.1 OsmY domain-containing protein [Cupriavidus sp. USMAA2-4]AOZ02085.1 OsmY domain-containing protein [Cupriavidus sp. USMAHM13]AOZ10526.1 OsmY domain-containing protein [Cupriavidus malaysiensis]